MIARNTAFTFKGKGLDAKEIGKDFGVAMCSKARCSATEPACGQRATDRRGIRAHVWADRFEEDAAELFKLQDEILARLANVWATNLSRPKRKRRRAKTRLIDLAMRGRALALQLPFTKDNNVAARALFERALGIDANNAAARAGERLYLHDVTGKAVLTARSN